MPYLQTIARPRKKQTALVINAVIHALYLLTLPIWYFISMFSGMLFDAPGSKRNGLILAFYYALRSYPYLVLGAIVLAWIMYRKDRYGWTYLIDTLPATIVIASAGMMAIFGE